MPVAVHRRRPPAHRRLARARARQVTPPTPCSARSSSGSGRCCWPRPRATCPRNTVRVQHAAHRDHSVACWPAQPIVVPVLRAGLGFLHAAQELLPNADVGFIGVSPRRGDVQPKSYVNKLPESLAGRQCIVLDPMLATGGSLAHACKLLVERGATGTIIVVCVLAAPEGIEVLEQRARPRDLHRGGRRAPQRERVHRARPRRRRRPPVRLARLNFFRRRDGATRSTALNQM
jgi:hypothetical protein